ncbi:hypothetical protein ABKV19_001480, partial [Rosa sericea]
VPRNERGELECLEKLVNKYERGQIQCVDWLDRLAFKAMERIKERESSKIEVCICTWLSISVVLNIMLFSRVVKETYKNTDGGTEYKGLATETYRMPFLMLGLDLSPTTLFSKM